MVCQEIYESGNFPLHFLLKSTSILVIPVVFLVHICIDISEFEFQLLQSLFLALTMLFQAIVDVLFVPDLIDIYFDDELRRR